MNNSIANHGAGAAKQYMKSMQTRIWVEQMLRQMD